METRFNRTLEYRDIVVMKNLERNKVEIFFRLKPEPDIIEALKNEGWKWQTYRNSWARKLTEAALRSCAKITRLNLDTILNF